MVCRRSLPALAAVALLLAGCGSPPSDSPVPTASPPPTPSPSSAAPTVPTPAPSPTVSGTGTVSAGVRGLTGAAGSGVAVTLFDGIPYFVSGEGPVDTPTWGFDYC